MERNIYYALAPLVLPNYRQRRYHGGDLCLPLEAFTSADQDRLRALYQYLEELLQRLSPEPGESTLSELSTFLHEQPPDRIARLATRIGGESYARQPSPLMAKALHDLRGGGLTPLLGQLQLSPREGLSPATVRGLFFLTRDHLKIMRNALTGLDDVRREEDFLLRVHSTDLIVEKWHEAVLLQGTREIRVEVDCPTITPVSECCVEFGSVDRILYNLLNNACRHAASDCLRLTIFRVPDAEGDNLRFILQNTVSETELAFLRTVAMPSLFHDGVSTTGSGCGLSIAAEFVSRAFGLGHPGEAVKEGYLGATLIEDTLLPGFTGLG